MTGLAGATDDFEAWTRPAASGAADIGAAEFEHLFRDGFESGGSSLWSAASP